MTKDEARKLCSIIPQSAYTRSCGPGDAMDEAYAELLNRTFPEHNWRIILDRSGQFSRWSLTVDDDDPRETIPVKDVEE